MHVDFVFLTLADNFGVVIAEAAACGLPLVVSRYGGASDEYVRPGENGFIVDPSEQEAIVKAVIEVLSETDRRHQMGAASRRIAEEKSLTVAVQNFAEAISCSHHSHQDTDQQHKASS